MFTERSGDVAVIVCDAPENTVRQGVVPQVSRDWGGWVFRLGHRVDAGCPKRFRSLS